MAGLAGNDSYYLDNVGDIVTESSNAGSDSVYATLNYTLTANVENLILTGTAANGTGNTLNNLLTGNASNNTLNGGAGADTLIGGLGKDTYQLTETTAANDTVRIATGDSLANNFDLINSFKPGTGTANTTGVDKLDLPTSLIAANTAAVNGTDSGTILSHSINNGIIKFDDLNTYTTPLSITATNLVNVFNYLQANITDNNTVAFISGTDTYVFQDGGTTDTLVELVGVVASSGQYHGFGNKCRVDCLTTDPLLNFYTRRIFLIVLISLLKLPCASRVSTISPAFNCATERIICPEHGSMVSA
jgi:hypothetical protein